MGNQIRHDTIDVETGQTPCVAVGRSDCVWQGHHHGGRHTSHIQRLIQVECGLIVLQIVKTPTEVISK